MLFQCLQEAAIEAKFTEVNAVNKQRLQNLEFAQSLLNLVKLSLHANNNINIEIKINCDNNDDFFSPCSNLRSL